MILPTSVLLSSVWSSITKPKPDRVLESSDCSSALRVIPQNRPDPKT